MLRARNSAIQPAMNFETIRISSEGDVHMLAVDRPKALNALNPTVIAEMTAALDHLAGQADARALIITGMGEKAFVAGADIAAMTEMTPAQADSFARAGHALMARIESLPIPVIAAVNGFALGGGCELALACDIIYASETAKFGLPEVKLGLIPGFGGTVRLARKVGYGNAAELIFSGEMIDAQRALALGLAQAVIPAAELAARAKGLAQTIASRGPLAVRAAKRALVTGMSTNPLTAAQIELMAFAGLFGTDDMREGTKAFVEKRAPSFNGR